MDLLQMYIIVLDDIGWHLILKYYTLFKRTVY